MCASCVCCPAQNKFADVISLTPSGLPWVANGRPLPTAAAAGLLGLLWSAEDAAAEAAVAAAEARLSGPVRERMHCWGLQMVSGGLEHFHRQLVTKGLWGMAHLTATHTGCWIVPIPNSRERSVGQVGELQLGQRPNQTVIGKGSAPHNNKPIG